MGRQPFAATELERCDRGCRLSGKVGGLPPPRTLEVYLLRERPRLSAKVRECLSVLSIHMEAFGNILTGGDDNLTRRRRRSRGWESF
jgi:hypothetical protein